MLLVTGRRTAAPLQCRGEIARCINTFTDYAAASRAACSPVLLLLLLRLLLVCSLLLLWLQLLRCHVLAALQVHPAPDARQQQQPRIHRVQLRV